MSSSAGHAMQKMISNIPIGVTVNDTGSVVVTQGGEVYQAGLIANHVQDNFKEIVASSSLVGTVVQAEAASDRYYLLNSDGSVFEHLYNSGSGTCPVTREIYSPTICNGDKAKRISAGSNHVLILTEKNKVWGAGDNGEYQLVPQGQCRYDTAVEVLVTDSVMHDNNSSDKFVGSVRTLDTPVIPNPSQPSCNAVSCLRNTFVDAPMGTVTVSGRYTAPLGVAVSGSFELPVRGSGNFVGFVCVDSSSTAAGNLTYNIDSLVVKGGCFSSVFTPDVGEPITVSVSLSNDLVLVSNIQPPFTTTVPISGPCGSTLSIVVPNAINVDSFTPTAGGIGLLITEADNGTEAILNGLQGGVVDFDSTILAPIAGTVDVVLAVPLTCCARPSSSVVAPELPQPCWVSVHAGFNVSVLVDSCHRMYVLGSLHRVRNNEDLLKRGGLEDLLRTTPATITLPADQLNCGVGARSNNCGSSTGGQFKMDYSKIGVQLNFANGYVTDDDACGNTVMRVTTNGTSVCDFLSQLRQVNEAPVCDNTCEPCDSYIYLNVAGDDECGQDDAVPLTSVVLHNRKSISKIVSQGSPDAVTVPVTFSSVVEFDLNKYCIDGTDYGLDKTITLDFSVDGGATVNLYLDIDTPGGVQFVTGSKCNVDFTVDANEAGRQLLLNYGSILDPVELTNLKSVLVSESIYPSPLFKNPFNTRVFNTYLKGGDKVKFIEKGTSSVIRHALTADLPSVFRLNRKVIDVAVGLNSLSVLVGNNACPSELYAIGNNCNGQLGIGSYASTLVWKNLNRCLFGGLVSSIHAGRSVTMYVTQSGHVYASGHYKNLVNSSLPQVIKSVNPCWKISDIDVSDSHVMMLSSDGCLFGLGDNNLGQLGICQCNCVSRPTAINFFVRMGQCAARQLASSLCHPVERNRECVDSCYTSEVRYTRARSAVPPKRYAANARTCPKRTCN